MRLVLPWLALALLAGCATPADDTTPEEVAPAADAPLDGTAGGTSATVTATNGTAAVVQHPFQHEGRVPAFAEACVVVVVMGNCVSAPPTAQYAGMFAEPDLTGTLVSGAITATWTPSDPSHQEMVVFAYSFSDDDYQSHGWAMGASGITLELQDLESFVEGGTLRVGLGPATRGMMQGGVGAWGTASPTEQPFTLDGLLLAQH